MANLKKGFTIVELVIVIAIIAILSVVLIPLIINGDDTVVSKRNETINQTFRCIG